jgi:hypothetical protein
MKPKLTPPERPRGKMLRDVTEVVERLAKNHKSLREDPKVKEMTTLLMTGRAAERQDLVEEVERLMRANYGNLPVVNALRAVRNWALERDARGTGG